MTFNPAFKAHLQLGATTVARAWEVTRKDGVRMGFTDHDRDLVFEGLTFHADGGLSARVVATKTGLGIDTGEIIGALSGAGVTEADIDAGRYDDAEVLSWRVNWQNTAERVLQFRGKIGEITKRGGAFGAEVKGLSDSLNVPSGRVYQNACSAVLGDTSCGFDLGASGFFVAAVPLSVEGNRTFILEEMPAFADRWFERGVFKVTDGVLAGISGVIKTDMIHDGQRIVELWEALPDGFEIGQSVRLVAGCDKRGETCRVKFSNFPNFRGFPHIPGEDWMMSHPRDGEMNDGGKRLT